MFLLLLSLVTSTFRPDHAVSLGVVAPWYGVPLFEQVLFYLSDYSDFISTTFLSSILKANQADNETYIWENAKSFLPTELFSLLQKEINLGYYLPRAEMYRETARTFCGSKIQDIFWIPKDDTPDNSDDVFKQFNIPKLPGSTIEFDFDITFNSGSSFVYANLHNQEVAQKILSMIQNEISFVLRPIAQTDKYGIPIRGFGIEMRPFRYSMEYGVKDSIVLDAASKQNTTFTDETTRLVKDIPESYVNVTNITNFGSRFCGFLKKHNETNLPRLIRDVTNNFPLFMSEISHSKPDFDSYDQVSRLITKGNCFSLINGRRVQFKHLDSFTILDIINEEKNLRNILESNFKMSPSVATQLSSVQLENDAVYFFDYETPNLTYFLNDIENDPEYASWGVSIRELFSTASFPRIRKNLFNIIFVGDPSTYSGYNNFLSLTSFIEKGFGIRVGLIPHFTLGNRLSRKVAFAFHHLALNGGERWALNFLIATMKYSGFNIKTYHLNPVDEQHFAASYESQIEKLSEKIKKMKGKANDAYDDIKLLHWDELYTLYDTDSEESKIIEKLNNFFIQTEMDPTMILLNGKPISLSHGTQGVVYELQRAVSLLASNIRQYRILSLENETAISILGRSNIIVSSFDNAILYESPTSTKIYHKPLSQQLSFVETMGNIEWNYTDEGRAINFYVLYSENETEISTFVNFAKDSKHHSVPSMFAINPTQIPERFLSLFDIKTSNDKNSLFVNGRIIKNHEITLQRLKVIDEWTSHTISRPLNESMQNIKYKRTDVMFFMSLVCMDWITESIERRESLDDVFEIQSSAVFNGKKENEGKLIWDIYADPFTRDFQRMASIIDYLQDVVAVRLVLVPPNVLTEPMTSYYRMALDNDRAIFSMLNDTTTYSSMPDMPDSWIFESMKASVDLDNILLSELSPSTHMGTYILTNLKADGVCAVDDGLSYAEGAELALFDSNNVKHSDTIVMRSNGYWQLAANPGIWTVDLGGQRSKSIYSMVTKHIIVTGFGQTSNILTVKVNPGMEGIKVYNLSVTPTTNTTRVDVFSVASGHLYERLLKIMMVAVRRRSKYNVKFWIIKAFLSPQFKATLPIMANKYNFSYQLVSYKWPQWLRPQYEKQRIIWGNKILFLDVLFPLDLERVIYIDSDQIVRTDLIELMRMDFGKAPYAFTPFCDSRKETEPFRFWKQGYWKDHLGEKKYHISALFAIDLRRFRQMAAGDVLRYHYQLLSADPLSLANLDQDLPNYAQDQIPIYSLPQNWLWCETWCSDETIDEAKTIDLCNNPLTKKPKLYVAQTMVKEWPGLDEEVRNISAGPDEYEKFFFKE
ncbi:hypothetical protein M9Y10_011641 [Tritrichomonas musculus]|uniref:Uncharacterized protein n=1 Tax=Tritrichomonas musculus TaxID=1915356 RepID=A0ABR2IJZ1_9EUKA